MESEEANVPFDDNHIDKGENSHLNELLEDAIGKEMKTVRVVTLENDLAQKDIIKSYMENEYGQVISGQYSEYASGSGETEEEVTMTNIKSIMVTANVKSTDENDNKYRMKEVNKDLRLHQLEEFTSKISESDMEMVEIQEEEKDSFNRHSETKKTSHDIVCYCFLPIVILLPCILLS